MVFEIGCYDEEQNCENIIISQTNNKLHDQISLHDVQHNQSVRTSISPGRSQAYNNGTQHVTKVTAKVR